MHIKAENITKTLGENTIFSNISFDVNEGEHVAIVGRNGCGKTTLFKVMAGIEHPDEGRIVKAKGQTIGYLHQIPDLKNVTVFEVLSLAFEKLHEMKQRLTNLEQQMTTDMSEKTLTQYGNLLEQYEQDGGYEIEAKIASIANGLKIHQLLEQSFEALSGGEKTKVMLA